MNEMPKNTKYDPVNPDMEIAITKMARAIFDYVKSQDDYTELVRITGISDVLGEVSDHYHNRTGSLHPDLGLELTEWIAFKLSLCSPKHDQLVREGKSNIDQAFVDSYAKQPENIIRYLEAKFGIRE